MYLISIESFKSLIRNKWQAWSLAIAAKHFMLKQKCQVKGRILNSETILFLTKTWCYECIKKISKHHSLPLLLKLEAVWWQYRGLGRVSALPCSPTAVQRDRVHTITCASACAPLPSKSSDLVKNTLCQQEKWWWPKSCMLISEMKGCKGLWICTSLTFSTASLETPGLPLAPVAALQPVSLIRCVAKTRLNPSKKQQLCFLYSSTWKKPLQWVPSTWGYPMLEPWVSLQRSTVSLYGTFFKLLFFSFPQSWPLLDLLKCRKDFR